MDEQDEPPRHALVDVEAMLDRSRADLATGRTLPIETVLAELDASIARMECNRGVKATDAA